MIERAYKSASECPAIMKAAEKIEQEYREKYAQLLWLATIADIIKSTKLAKYSGVEISYQYRVPNYWTSDPRLEVNIKYADIETVINYFCSAIHQKLGIDWKMEVYPSYIELKTKFRPPVSSFVYDIKISVHGLEEVDSCTIEKKMVGYYEAREAQPKYEYVMHCNGEV